MILITLLSGIILCVLSGVSKAVMDKVNFHFKQSIFNSPRFKEQFWNHEISHSNKWKNGDKRQGERFWKSSTWFVMFTDAWHLFQFFTRTFLVFGVCLVLTSTIYILNDFLAILISSMSCMIVQSGVFEQVFSKILEKKS